MHCKYNLLQCNVVIRESCLFHYFAIPLFRIRGFIVFLLHAATSNLFIVAIVWNIKDKAGLQETKLNNVKTRKFM